MLFFESSWIFLLNWLQISKLLLLMEINLCDLFGMEIFYNVLFLKLMQMIWFGVEFERKM